jgi:outer membrane lipoprotein LolB
MRAVLAWCALLSLAACQSVPPLQVTPWPERRATLQAVDQYSFTGKLAAATASDGFSASLSWQQQGATSDVLLRAPLGVGGAHLNYDGGVLRLTDSHGAQLDGAAAQEQIRRMFGFDPPLASLRYWLLGVPDPATASTETLDGAQRLAALRQDDWRVDYSEYQQSAGQWLPRRLALQRGGVKLKLQIAHWQLP